MHPELTQWIRPEASLSGKAWRWRGGNMDMAQGAAGGLNDDIVTHCCWPAALRVMICTGIARPPCARSCPIRPNFRTWKKRQKDRRRHHAP
jgi:hypothetical protein